MFSDSTRIEPLCFFFVEVGFFFFFVFFSTMEELIRLTEDAGGILFMMRLTLETSMAENRTEQRDFSGIVDIILSEDPSMFDSC